MSNHTTFPERTAVAEATPPRTPQTQSYVATGSLRPGGTGRLEAHGLSVSFDGTAGRVATLPGPADLLAAAMCACVLKNVERFALMLQIPYEAASVDVVAERDSPPPHIVRIHYRLRLVTDASPARIDLLHKNIRHFGTIANTLGNACQVSGEVIVEPMGTAALPPVRDALAAPSLAAALADTQPIDEAQMALLDAPLSPLAHEFHLSLRVADLAASSAFYRWLLGVEPKDTTARYTTFLSPALHLNLVLLVADGRELHQDSLYHLGIAVADRAAVIRAQHQAEVAGYTVTKPARTTWRGTPLHELWLSDPGGNAVEIYARLTAAELAEMPADQEPLLLGPG